MSLRLDVRAKPRATDFLFRHYRWVDGRKHLIWGSTLGEVLIPTGTKEHFDALMSQLWEPNNVADEGENAILDVFFRAGTAPTNFFLRLYNDSGVVDTDTLASITGETTGTGYPGTHTIERNTTGWPTLSLQSGDYRVDSKTITWTAGSNWTNQPINTAVLATVTSGTGGLVILYKTLSTPRTVVNTDQLLASIRLSQA